jgi:hypothetical protein
MGNRAASEPVGTTVVNGAAFCNAKKGRSVK